VVEVGICVSEEPASSIFRVEHFVLFSAFHYLRRESPQYHICNVIYAIYEA
jgi:hypothetical protein